MTAADEALTRGAGKALWRQITEALEAEVLSGRLAPGERLPTEHQLAAQYAVNRHTVRRAVAALAEQGLVRIEQGRGTFVQEDVIAYRVARRTRFTENLVGREVGRPLLHSAELPAEEAVARALELERGAPVTLLESMGEADGRPISVASHYFPLARFPDMAAVYAETGSVTRALARFGVLDFHRKVTKVTARMPRAADARILQQPANRPILMAESINVDGAGIPVEYTVTRFASDRVQIVFEPEA